MADIADVARRAGVSIATVSRALNGKSASAATRQKVVDAAAELGYVISSSASGLATGRTRHIGFMVPFIDRWFFTALLTGVESVLLSQGYDVTLYDLQGNDTQRDQVFGSSLRRASIDGLIAASIELTPDEVLALRALGKPVVSIGGFIEGATAVDVDNARMAALATEHLLSLGHTRIAYVGAGRTIASAFQLGDARYDGWMSAMRSAGLEVDESGLWEADFDIPSGYAAAKELLAHDRPTAIFAASDEIGIGCMLAARDLGLRVPDDLSVVGIDDHKLSTFFGLTTLAQDPAGQGRLAAHLMLAQLDNPAAAPEHRTLQPRFVVRSSTARPGGAVHGTA